MSSPLQIISLAKIVFPTETFICLWTVLSNFCCCCWFLFLRALNGVQREYFAAQIYFIAKVKVFMKFNKTSCLAPTISDRKMNSMKRRRIFSEQWTHRERERVRKRFVCLVGLYFPNPSIQVDQMEERQQQQQQQQQKHYANENWNWKQVATRMEKLDCVYIVNEIRKRSHTHTQCIKIPAQNDDG